MNARCVLTSPRVIRRSPANLLGRNTVVLMLGVYWEVLKNKQARGYKTVFILNSAEHEIPTIVGILIFICMINTTSESLEASNFFIFLSVFSFLRVVEISCLVELSRKKVYNPSATSMILYHCSVVSRKNIFRIVFFKKLQ